MVRRRNTYRRLRQVLAAKECGHTILEVMVAFSLLLIILIPLGTALGTAQLVTGKSRSRTTAVNLADRELERARLLTFDDVLSEPETTEIVGTKTFYLKTRVTWLDDDYDQVEPRDPIPADYKRVTVTVRWDNMGGLAPVRLMSIVARRSEEAGVNEGNLRVYVNDSQGDPVEDVRIQISGPESPTDWTDENGQVLFPYLRPSPRPNDYTVTASKSRYIDERGEAEATQNATVNASQTTHVVLVLERPGSLVLRLVDPLGNLVNKRSRVTLDNETLGTQDFSSRTGEFEIDDLFPAWYELTASAASYEPTPAPISVELTPAETSELNVALTPHPPAQLHLEVFDGRSGERLGPAAVTITNNDGGPPLETDTNGNGLLEASLAEGVYTVNVVLAGYGAYANSNVVLEASRTARLRVDLNPSP